MTRDQLSTVTATATISNKGATTISNNSNNSFTYITPSLYSGIPGSIMPKKVIYNDPATIVYWTDDTKTVVKTCAEDEFNEQTGLLMCIAKRFLGNKGLKKTLKTYTKNYD